MPSLKKTVHPIHFEDFSGEQFERLAFAFLLRFESWESLDWYGQLGSDLGRDIWGVRQKGNGKTESVCIQCANRKTLPSQKAIDDIEKVIVSPKGKPDLFRFICGGKVSATTRDRIVKHSTSKGIDRCEIWTSIEFEELLRKHVEPVLRRFCEGEEFPDSAADLKRLAQNSTTLNDQDILERMSHAFDRPAFHTHFHQESSLPDFKQAITDTIQVLNTGIWQTRDGKEIDRFPSRFSIKSPNLKSELEDIERKLVGLRARFDELIRTGEIRNCGCNVPDCPTYFFSPRAVEEMNTLRSQILSKLHQIHPQFSPRLGW